MLVDFVCLIRDEVKYVWPYVISFLCAVCADDHICVPQQGPFVLDRTDVYTHQIRRSGGPSVRAFAFSEERRLVTRIRCDAPDSTSTLLCGCISACTRLLRDVASGFRSRLSLSNFSSFPLKPFSCIVVRPLPFSDLAGRADSQCSLCTLPSQSHNRVCINHVLSRASSVHVRQRKASVPNQRSFTDMFDTAEQSAHCVLQVWSPFGCVCARAFCDLARKCVARRQ